MKEEIEEGKDIVGAKEKLIAERDAWLQKESHYFNRIVSAYYDDYENPLSLNDLKTFLSLQQNPQALLHLVEMYIREKSFNSAMNTLDVVSGFPDLNPTVQAQVQGYNSLINILISMSEDSIPWNSIDSVHATLLFDIYDLACPEVSSFAGNLLAASGLFEFGRVFNFTEVVKSAFGGNQEGTDENCFDENAAYRIYPNPADYYLILEYNDPGENKTLIVTDSFGRKVLEKQMFELQDQLILDIHTFPLGSYTISVISNKKVIYSTPFIIAR